jgi:tetratricopeptide (TPR) repeat protein
MAGIETREVLESWKEISDYLNRDVKTCRRWEQHLDLPIRRLDGTPKARVFAYKDELDFWLEDKLNNREISTTKYLRIAKKKPKRFWIALPVTLALIIVAAIATRILPRIDFLSPPPEKPRLAVLPIKNFTGDESLGNLRAALTNLIITDLYQSKYIQVLNEERLNKVLSDIDKLETDSYTTDDMKKIASLVGVTHFLTGTVTKFGEKIRINASIQKAGDWEISWSKQFEGTENDLFDMVDRMTPEIKSQFHLTAEQLADDIDAKVATVTTDNPDALKYYVEGMQYALSAAGMQAMESFRKAVEIDPEFAMAYRGMWILYNMGRERSESEAKETIQKAMDLMDRLSPREQFLIKADYYRTYDDDFDRAIATYKELLVIYPDDFAGNYTLGRFLWEMRDFEGAKEYLLRLFPTAITYPSVYNYGSMAYSMTHDLEGARKVHQDRLKAIEEMGLRDIPKFSHIGIGDLHWVANTYLMEKRYNLALKYYDLAAALDPDSAWYRNAKAFLYLIRDDFDTAEIYFDDRVNSETDVFGRLHAIFWRECLLIARGQLQRAEQDLLAFYEENEKEIRGTNWEHRTFNALGDYYLRMNRPEEALGMFEKSMNIYEKETLGDITEILFNLGRTYIELGDLAKAESTLGELDKKTSKGWNNRNRHFWRYLRGRLALASNQTQKAVEYMEDCVSNFWGASHRNRASEHGLFFDTLASAYKENGDVDKAIDTYKGIQQLTAGRYAWGDIYAKSFYNLGMLYESLGKIRAARKNYEKFLELWKDADYPFQAIDDAKARLAALQ